MKKWWLTAFLVLGLALRLYLSGSLPVSLNRDEAALAYNAYLLSETGRDEWGKEWPLALESFGDYKLIGYPATVVPVISFFGLADWVVKLPSVIAGTLLIALAYYFARDVLKFHENTALTAAFLIAITPVFFFYSRIAFEANLALTLFVSALWILFSKPHSFKQWQHDGAGLILMALATITYNTPLLLLPFVIVAIPLWRGLKQWKTRLGIVSGLTLIFVGVSLILLPLTSQKSGITLFSNPDVFNSYIEYRSHFPSVLQKLFGNKYIYFGLLMSKNVLASFGPNFLVIHGGTHPWHQLPGFAHLTWVEYGAALIGLGVVAFEILKRKTTSVLLLFLLLVSLAPAVITVDAPHATRSLFFFFLLVLIAARGLEFLSQSLAQRMKKPSEKVLVTVLAIVVVSSLPYFYSYFTNYSVQSRFLLQGQIQDVLADVESNNYPQVAVVDPDGYLYILVAWYTAMKPETFYETQVRQLPNRIGFRYGERVGRYHFIAQPDDRQASESALIQWRGNHWAVIRF